MISPSESSSKAHEPAGLISSFAIVPKCVVGKNWLRPRKSGKKSQAKLKLISVYLPVERCLPTYQPGTILPKTTARRAPVAEGTLPGRPRNVSCASKAKASGSLAELSIPKSSCPQTVPKPARS
jgi:hypothetical protein